MASSPQGIPDIFTLDERKLQTSESSDKQELYLLQWLAHVERECKTIDLVHAHPPFGTLLILYHHNNHHSLLFSRTS